MLLLLSVWFVLAAAVFIGHTLGNLVPRGPSSRAGRWSGLGLGIVMVVLVIGVFVWR